MSDTISKKIIKDPFENYHFLLAMFYIVPTSKCEGRHLTPPHPRKEINRLVLSRILLQKFPANFRENPSSSLVKTSKFPQIVIPKADACKKKAGSQRVYK